MHVDAEIKVLKVFAELQKGEMKSQKSHVSWRATVAAWLVEQYTY